MNVYGVAVIGSTEAATGVIEISPHERPHWGVWLRLEGLGVQMKKVVTRVLVRRLEAETRKSKIQNR